MMHMNGEKMKILDPVLAPDVSIWCDHIKPNEFEDEGCVSVVVGLYPVQGSHGEKILSPTSRQQCIDVATKSSMVLQAYFWDDIIQDPIKQADWLIQTIKSEGLPIKWVWVDQEQWWSNWTAWSQARAGKIPWSQVPAGAPANINSHNENFMRRLHAEIPQSGVYTNKGFVSSWAPGMDKWLSQYRAWVPHFGKQPKESVQMTWEQLKENWLPDYDISLSAGQKPELVAGHQFTGDCCKLPGSYSKDGGTLVLDVSVFRKAFINEIMGTNPTPEPPASTPPEVTPAPTTPPDVTPAPATTPAVPPGTIEYIVQFARINVRAKPDSNSAWVRFAVKDEVLYVAKIEGGWAKLSDGTYVFAGYISPKSGNVPVPTPTPASTPVPTPTPAPVPIPSPQPATLDYAVLYARINVRTKPDSNSTWVRFAVKDEVLHVVKIENGWAQLLDGTYVFEGYIKKI
jgi:hypothetical protein